MMFDTSFFEWIEKYKNIDPSVLRLKFLSSKNYDEWIPVAISHIASLKKAKQKLSGESYNLLPEIVFPEIALEQCSSLETANFHSSIIRDRFKGQKIDILDMTCGLGIDSMAFLNSGHRIIACETGEIQYKIAKYNFRDKQNFVINHQDSVEFLKNTSLHFDAVFIDPSRRNDKGERVYSIIDCSPNIIDLLPLLTEKSEFILIKVSPMLDLHSILRDIPGTSMIYIVAVKDECKEILISIDTKKAIAKQDQIPIILHHELYDDIRFTIEEERNIELPVYCSPQENDYLYYPLSYVMKSGCYNCFAGKFNLKVLSPNSHLFWSSKIDTSVPSKIYRVNNIFDWSSSVLRSLRKQGISSDVTARNFPFTTKEIVQKLKLKSSDKFHIFATKDNSNNLKLIFCENIK